MAKRKITCSLDEVVGEYLKKRKCGKSSKLFEEKVEYHKNDRIEMLEKFSDFLKLSEIKKEIKIEDLGFEIDFGAYKIERNVSFYEYEYIPQLYLVSFHLRTTTN